MDSIFNHDKALSHTMNDRTLLQELIQFAIDDIPGMLSTLKLYLDEKRDNHEIAELAHKVKGSAGAISGEKLFSAAFELEELAKEGKTSCLNGQYILVEKAFNEFRQDSTVQTCLSGAS